MVSDPSAHDRLIKRLKRALFGKPKNLGDRSIYHRLSLIPFLAWVGLGADGLSSSAYGPEEAFKSLGEHKYLAVFLVALMAFTVLIISAAYRRIIEAFPHGGGGYVVASKLLGRKTGLVSGCALLVDYVLTITISVAAAGDAIFSFLPSHFASWKMTVEIGTILALTTLNIRGVRESVLVLTPVFVIFLVTHVLAIGLGIVGHAPEAVATATAVSAGIGHGMGSLGPWALFLIFIHAYSLGGGTYTGIEAVSNGLPIMREPKVATAKRTMTYMALSLAFTASGLLLCYLLWRTAPVEGKTLNAVLLEQIAGHFSLGSSFVILSLLAEGLLLVVAAQAGFIDGPRVLANMAVDSWVPRRFAALSERLTTANGIVLMGGAALVALVYTHGNVGQLVVMYSINVFLTFSLSIFGMLKASLSGELSSRDPKSLTIFSIGFVLCALILIITVYEKFSEGGWLTLVITGLLIALCLSVKRHYLEVAQNLNKLKIRLDRENLSEAVQECIELDPQKRTAAVLVGGYGGLGIHTVQSILKTFPGVFSNFIFVSVGVVDSDGFKGESAIDELRANTQVMLEKYVTLARSLGVAAGYRFGIGTDVVAEGEVICTALSQEFPQCTFFTGKIIFEQERWFQRLLHNETGLALQKRLQIAGLTLVVLPAKVA